MNDTKATSVGFLIFPGFPMACLTSVIEPLRAANEIAGTQAFVWTLVAETAARVASSAQVLFDPDTTLADLTDVDILFLLSGPMARFENPRTSNGTLRTLERHGAVLGGISGGVFPLVASGLMEGHTCSVHWCYAAAFQSEFPRSQSSDEVIVMDRRRYTASGAAAAFDLALSLIESRLGEEIATEVACWFQHPLMRGVGVRQRTPAIRSSETDDMLPEAIKKAIDIFADHIEQVVSVQEVAHRVGLSQRHLERSFKTATGQSPSHYYRALRMKAARQLVMHSRDSIADIALAVGYTSATPLVRHYRGAFGLSPQEERQKVNQFRVQKNAAVPSS